MDQFQKKLTKTINEQNIIVKECADKLAKCNITEKRVLQGNYSFGFVDKRLAELNKSKIELEQLLRKAQDDLDALRLTTHPRHQQVINDINAQVEQMQQKQQQDFDIKREERKNLIEKNTEKNKREKEEQLERKRQQEQQKARRRGRQRR